VLNVKSEAEIEEREVLKIESMVLQHCNVLQVTAAEREREREGERELEGRCERVSCSLY